MPPIRVVVVDDSAVLRRLVSLALRSAGDVEVVATAENGAVALDVVAAHRPDLVTMDVEMPVMDGIAAVRELRRRGSSVPVVMFSTLTENGARATFAALAAGATHYVTKPSGAVSASAAMAAVRDELVPMARALVPRPGAARTPPAQRRRPAPAQAAPAPVVPAAPAVVEPTAPAPRDGGPAASTPVGRPPVVGTTPGRPAPVPVAGRAEPLRAPAVVAVGSSTGGPEALVKVVTALPAGLPVPVVITQHMPPVFTAQLAARLDRLGHLTVREAAEGMPLRPGEVVVAPGDRHLEITGRPGAAVCHLSQAPPEHHCRPAVDVMLRSLVDVYGASVLAVVLTGMGSDGRLGCGVVRAAGGQVVAQDEATSVVWGMPGSVVTAGLAHQVLPLDAVAPAVAAACLRGRRPAAAATAAREGAR